MNSQEHGGQIVDIRGKQTCTSHLLETDWTISLKSVRILILDGAPLFHSPHAFVKLGFGSCCDKKQKPQENQCGKGSGDDLARSHPKTGEAVQSSTSLIS